MRVHGGSARGFSFTEMMLTVAVTATIAAVSVPVLTNVTESAKLNAAAREVERELQSSRLRAVSSNRILRVRMNCPAAGYYRTVEFLVDPTKDNATNRCLLTAYPFPAADDDIMTRPNYDGPMRTTPPGTTISSAVVEFHPDGTARTVVSNVSQDITTPASVTVTRRGKTRSITINGAGKIQLQP